MSNEWSPNYLGQRGEAAGDVPANVEPIPPGSLDAALAGPVPEPGTNVVFAGLSAKVMETDTSGPYPRTRIQYWATGQREWVPTDGLKSRKYDVRVHSSDDMCGLPELDEFISEPVAVVIRPDGSVDAYGYIAVVDQR